MPRVRFFPSDAEIVVPKGTRLIDAVREAGLPIARACGDDLICAKCGVEILSGKVGREAAIEARMKARNRVPEKLRLACAIRVHDDLEITAPYWGPLERGARALIVVDHGSRRPEAHAHLEALAAALRERAPELKVYPAHMELAEPGLGDAVAAAIADGARAIAVHPLFLVPGRHLAEDIPRLVAEAAEQHPEVEITIGESLGASPGLADLVLRTVRGER